MDLSKQQQNIDIKVCLKILKDEDYLHPAQRVCFDTYFVIVSARFKQVSYHSRWHVTGIGNPLLSFDDIFQSFTDPERPTEEEFVMFKLQYGVDWIVEPKGWNL